MSGTVVDANPRWYLVVAEGDANWVSARYVRNVGPGPEHCDPSDGTYAKGQKFRVQCYTDSGQKWYLTETSKWVSAQYVRSSSEVRYCSNL